MATYFADTSYWMALSRKRDGYNRQAVAWNQFVIRTRSAIVTTEAVLWEWLNTFSNASTRATAAEGYRRAHSDPRIEVVPFRPQTDRFRAAALPDEVRQELEPHRLPVLCGYGAAPTDGGADHRPAF